MKNKFYNFTTLPLFISGTILAWNDINDLRITTVCYGIAATISFYYMINTERK